MPELRVRVVLPYYLRLGEGDYQITQDGEVIHVLAPILEEAKPPRTPLWARFSPEASADPEVIQRLRARRTDPGSRSVLLEHHRQRVQSQV